MISKLKFLAPIFIMIILPFLSCNDNPIWERFAKNPHVKLGINGKHAYVDFENEKVRITTGPDAGQTPYGQIVSYSTSLTRDGVTITREFNSIAYHSTGRIRSYKENRGYNPGGRYKIYVYDIEYNSLGRPVSFKAEIDGYEYSYP